MGEAGKVRSPGFISGAAGIGSHTGLCVHVSLAGSHERNSLEGALGSRVSPPKPQSAGNLSWN